MLHDVNRFNIVYYIEKVVSFMTFVKENSNTSKLPDNVFAVTQLAKQAKKEFGSIVVDATIGSLYEEDGTIAAFKTVYDCYNQIDNKLKASYSSAISGDESYLEAINQWVFQDEDVVLEREIIATAGGTGAISLAFKDILNPGDTVLIPDLAWASYRIMAETYQLKTDTYSMFEGNDFNISSFTQKCRNIMKKQKKLLVVINSPCHNPTGYSLTLSEWQQVIDCLNELQKEGPCILLNDIAYIDFSYQENERAYLSLLNQIENQFVVIIAFSCSKTLTSYGMRCGAAVILAKEKQSAVEIKNVFERSARAIWSNINHGWMENFTLVTKYYKDIFLKEKQKYVDLLKDKSEIFIKEANECGLAIYPYKEGFFVTIPTEDSKKAQYHQALMDHHIYTVQVAKGIRVALCSVPKIQVYGLAKRIKEVIQ